MLPLNSSRTILTSSSIWYYKQNHSQSCSTCIQFALEKIREKKCFGKTSAGILWDLNFISLVYFVKLDSEKEWCHFSCIWWIFSNLSFSRKLELSCSEWEMVGISRIMVATWAITKHIFVCKNHEHAVHILKSERIAHRKKWWIWPQNWWHCNL